MKRLVFCPAGRRLWFDLADRLDAEGLATPVIWFGDATHEDDARARYPDCSVLPIDQLYFGRFGDAPRYTGAYPEFWASPEFLRLRDHADKMYDRIDVRGSMRGPTRSVAIDGLVMWALELVARQKPDAMILAEAPHSAASYVLFEICGWLGLPRYCFSGWGFLPALSLRDGIDGPFLPFRKTAQTPVLDARIAEMISEFRGRVVRSKTDDSGPDYMARQRRTERRRGWLRRLQAPGVVAADPGKSIFDEDTPPRWRAGRRRLIRAWHLSRLENTLKAESGAIPASGYVYVPLHYEPERTTNPEGGPFHDQLRALAALRALVPPDLSIVAKEHPSQIMERNKGYLGRSAAFYSMAKRIDGVTIVGTGTSSNQLLQGAKLVATITGTAALEAAFLGKPSLVFGAPWFAGCPNVYSYRPGLEFDKMKAVADADDVEAWLGKTYAATAAFGTVNPSNERLHQDLYDDDVRSIELQSLIELVGSVLGAGSEAPGPQRS